MKSLAAVIAASLLSSAAIAQTVPAEVKQVGICMAYYAIKNGMDGSRDVDAGTAGVMRDLGTRLYEEGAKANMSEAKIQDAVVAELMNLNAEAKQSGVDVAIKGLSAQCDDLVSSIRGLH
jgi:hypothetical protein